MANCLCRRLDETAARQRQREEEAEARRAIRRADPAAAPVPSRAEPERSERPRLNLAPRTGGGPSWRERQAAKEAAGGSAAPAPAPAAAPAAEQPKEDVPPLRKTGGYVPPHLRGAAAPAAPPSNGAQPERERYVPRRAEAPVRPQPSDESKPSTQKWTPRWRQQQ